MASVLLAQEMPKPGPEHAVLKKLEGTWDAAVKFGEDVTKGTLVYKMDLGGLWLLGNFTGEFGGEKFMGRSMDSYDPVKKKYVSVWIDSMSTTPMVMEGNFDAAGKVQTMLGQGPGPDGKPMKYRIVINHAHPDKLLETMYGISEDGQEMEIMSIVYTRRK